MTATLEKLDGLSRKLSCQVSAEAMTRAVDQKANHYCSQLKLPGFRANKPLPKAVVLKRYGDSIREEVRSELMQEVLEKALEEHDIHVASRPEVDRMEMRDDHGFVFDVTFEQYPEIKMKDLDKLTIERPVVAVSEAAIDEAVEKVRQENRVWEETDAPTEDGCRLTTDFSAVDEHGEGVPGTQAKGVDFTLGEGRMLADFEAALQGKVAGDTVEFPLTFPEDYHASELQGKQVQFAVTIHKVESGRLPELDQALFEAVGSKAESVEAFRSEIQETLQKELDAKVRSLLKERLNDALIQANTLEIPKSLVDDETKRLQKRGADEDKVAADAVRNVHLMLLLRHVLDDRNIELDPERLDACIREHALPYIDEEQFVSWVYQDKNQLERMKGMALEEQLYDYLLEQVSFKDKNMSTEKLDEQLDQA